jgi:hypothetical protein
MPTATPNSVNEFIEQQLDARILDLQKTFDADAIAFTGPLVSGVDTVIRNAVDSRSPSSPRLVCILTTEGGYVEVVRRIVDVFRRDYGHVEFIVPDYAYSAGTILAMSGDAIHMDYYSRLGPIDPQIEGRDGQMLPALGYLERYEALVKKAKDGDITMAEVQLMISGFDQAELYKYDQARELSITLLKEWLVKYKFKSWSKTRTSQRPVTMRMKKIRAATIAKKLNDTRRWHSHGHGISREVLERDLNLIIDDFGANAEIAEAVRCYYSLLDDYMIKLGHVGAVHMVGSYTPFMSMRGGGV